MPTTNILPPMNHLVLLVLLASCGDHINPVITIMDAPTDSPHTDASAGAIDAPQASMPSTWFYAFLDKETYYCKYQERCDPYWFLLLFDNSLNDCLSYLAQQDCTTIDPYHLATNCQTAYPYYLYEADNQCGVDMAASACTGIVPDSCRVAFTPPVN